MSKSIKKFYTVVIVAILVIALSIGLNIYKENKAIRNKNSAQSVGIVQGMQGIEDLFEDNQSITKQQEEPQSPEPVKAYTNGFKCFTDAINKINNSKGFKAITTSSGQATILGITENQYLKETFILSGDYYLREQQGYSTSSLGKFFYRYWYSNNNAQSIRYKETSKLTSNSLEANPDWSGKTFDTTISLEELYKYDPYAYNVFTILPTKKSEMLGSFDPTEDKNYYIIRFRLDLAAVPDYFVENLKYEAGLTNVILNSLERTFYIEKSTLNLRKIDRTDAYIMEKGIVKGECYLTAQTVFVGVDKVYEPQEPTR